MKIKWSKGFTIIELMITVAIVGILFAVIAGAVDIDKKRQKAKADASALASAPSAAAVAHAAGHDYTDSAYYKTVVTNASGDYQPVCVHGIPAFIVKRGNRAGELILLGNYRGNKPGNRFWSACYKMGNDLVKEHVGD